MRYTSPDFGIQLHEHGFRATPGRIRLLWTLWFAKRPLTVDEIARRINKDVVTVYRALEDLREAGLIVRGIGAAGISGDRKGDIRVAHFSYAKKDHHHHLICADCGFTKPCAVCA
jgi:Fe2+ or Zn2+ uptake regulation protein